MLKTLRDITQSVAAAADLQSALDLLVQQTKNAMNIECCSVYILEEQALVFSATDGLSPSVIGRVKIPLTQGLVGLVAQREEAINLADARSHPRFKHLPEVSEDSYRAFLAVPIIYQKKVVGVIVVQQREQRLFSEAEEAFLMTLAAQLAMAIRGLHHKSAVQNTTSQFYFNGKCASNGIVVAQALVLGGQISLDMPQARATDIKAETIRLAAALDRCRENLSALSQRFEHAQEDEVQSIFSALIRLLDPESLAGEYQQEVNHGWSAESAVCRVSTKYIAYFLAMEDRYLRERSGDIRDLAQRVLRQLVEPEKVIFEPDTPVILIVKEASASLLAEFPRKKLAGIVTELGGINSHAAILARALGVPALMEVSDILSADIDHKQIVLNATRGLLIISPSSGVLKEYEGLISGQRKQQALFAKELASNTLTVDGKRIYLYANAGLLSSQGEDSVGETDGIGLYRTEILFMQQPRFPSESEQVDAYRKVLASCPDKPVVMRTLDVGGDKPLPYLPINEDNPFLGWRGIRLSLDHPELFLSQLRAMLLAGRNSSQFHILLPMVSNLQEIDISLNYLKQAHQELEAELGGGVAMPKIGVMLEVPVLLYQIDEVAKRVDFVSVGSNDLTQYLLAVDRNNVNVSSLFDSYHPGVLKALKQIRLDCQHQQLPVSVCGELAGEPMGALLLIAMGYTQLSMNQTNIARINYLIRHIALNEIVTLFDKLIKEKSGEDVKSQLAGFLADKNLSFVVQ